MLATYNVGDEAMVIFNNMAAMSALNETNRNTSKLGKVIKQAASGMRINSAGDDASGYSISERMKVRLRALNQDSENVRILLPNSSCTVASIASTMIIIDS